MEVVEVEVVEVVSVAVETCSSEDNREIIHYNSSIFFSVTIPMIILLLS